jgi:hypothetical protein
MFAILQSRPTQSKVKRQEKISYSPVSSFGNKELETPENSLIQSIDV